MRKRKIMNENVRGGAKSQVAILLLLLEIHKKDFLTFYYLFLRSLKTVK